MVRWVISSRAEHQSAEVSPQRILKTVATAATEKGSRREQRVKKAPASLRPEFVITFSRIDALPLIVAAESRYRHGCLIEQGLATFSWEPS
jgi:hypothetical protein